MRKNSFTILLSLWAFSSLYAQVGVNTTTPKSTLDVSAKRDNTGSITDNSQLIGLQAPRVTRAELSSNTATYGADQKGALIYVTDISGGNTTGNRVNITSVGYYYFDGTLWQKISLGSTVLPVTNVTLISTDFTYAANQTNPLYTGQSISLPPGKWMVVLAMGIEQTPDTQPLDVTITTVSGNQVV